MIFEYITILYKRLMEMGFAPNLPAGAADYAITRDTPMTALQRQFGQSLCYVLLINAEKLDFDRFQANLERLDAAFKGFIDRQGSGRVYILNVFVSEYEDARVQAFIQSAGPLEGQSVSQIFWAQRLREERRFSYSQKQTDDMFNLKGACDAAFARLKEEPDGARPPLVSISVSHLKDEAENASPFKPRRVNPLPMWGIIFINLLLVVAMTADGGSTNTETLVSYGALVPERVLRAGEYYRLVTAMFLHAGFMHFLSNALGLWIFYPRAAKYYGNLRLLSVYFLAGLFGNCCMTLFDANVAVGASGAVYGVMGAAVALAAVSGRDLDGISVYVLVIFVLVGFAFSFLMPDVGQAAHIGGFLLGLAYGFFHCRRLAKGRPA